MYNRYITFSEKKNDRNQLIEKMRLNIFVQRKVIGNGT